MPITYIPSQSLEPATTALAAAKSAKNQPITYVPKVKDYSIDKSVKDNLTILKGLLEQDRLNVQEIKQARQIIHMYATDKSTAYLKLQEKVIYVNQRDNQATAKGIKIEDRIYGGTCNVSSLSMALKYMGVSTSDLLDFLKKKGFKVNQNMQYEDLVEYAGQQGVPKWDRYNNNQLGALAKVLGYDSYKIKNSNGYLGEDWYNKNVLPQLQAGKAAIMSINGHIVRIQGMNENGLIVDDPFGQTKLKPGLTTGNYGITKANQDGTSKGYNYSKKNVEGNWNEGEDNTWSWSALQQHGTFWVRVIG